MGLLLKKIQSTENNIGFLMRPAGEERDAVRVGRLKLGRN